MVILSTVISFVVGVLVAVGLWFFMSKWGMEKTTKGLTNQQKEDSEIIRKTMVMTNEEIIKDASLTDGQRGMILFTRSQNPKKFEGREVK